MSFPEDKLQIVSVAVDEEKEKVIKFIKEKGMNWIHLFQSFDDKSKNSYTNQYKVQSFPTTLLIDMEGKILYKNLRGKELINTLNKIIK
jgi:thioredoxin-related protein